jgi:hypothetical protein
LVKAEIPEGEGKEADALKHSVVTGASNVVVGDVDGVGVPVLFDRR